MKFYERLSSFSTKHPALIALLIAIIIIFSFLAIFTSKIESDVTRIIPLHGEKTSLYFKILKKFGGMENFYIIFSSDNIKNQFTEIDNIGKEIGNSGLATKVEWKLTDETKVYLKNVFSKNAVLFLSEKEMSDFKYRLTPAGIERELRKTNQRLNMPGGQGMLAKLDPLNLHEFFSSHIKFNELPFDMMSGYFMTPDGSIIMRIVPKGSPRDIGFTKKLIDKINAIIKKKSNGLLKTEITGTHAIAFYEASVIKEEILKNIVSSLLGVILVFVFFFRSFKALFYAVLPVSISIVVTVGLTVFLLGSITEVVGAFAALLIGLGADLGIVLYVRYISSITSGMNHKAAAEQSIRYAGMGITTGMLTTAFAFYPMIFSSFKGIRELGILTGTGIIFTWLFLFTVIPLIMKPSRITTQRAPLLVAKLLEWSYTRPYAVFLIVILFTLIALPFIPKLEMKGNINELGTRDNPYRITLEKLQKKYIKEQGFVITGIAGNAEDAVRKCSFIKEAVKDRVEHMFGPDDILPSVLRQKNNIKQLKEINSGAVIRSFAIKTREMGFTGSAFKDYTDRLKGLIENRKTITINDLGPIKDVMEKLLKKEGQGYRFLMTGNLKKDVSASVIEETISKIGASSPESSIAYTGPSYVRQELLEILTKDAIVITLIGFALVNIMLYLDFRRFYYVLLCQIPVLISIIWVLGMMGIFNVDLNFMNATVFVMLFGIGTDYTIHLIHRYSENNNSASVAQQTGQAVVLAGLTTIVAFGSLGFSSYRGLASMGIVSGLGVTFCLILSLSLTPAFLKICDNKKSENENSE